MVPVWPAAGAAAIAAPSNANHALRHVELLDEPAMERGRETDRTVCKDMQASERGEGNPQRVRWGGAPTDAFDEKSASSRDALDHKKGAWNYKYVMCRRKADSAPLTRGAKSLHVYERREMVYGSR